MDCVDGRERGWTGSLPRFLSPVALAVGHWLDLAGQAKCWRPLA